MAGTRSIFDAVKIPITTRALPALSPSMTVRWCQRPNLDDKVDALPTGKFEHLISPLRLSFVIDQIRGAHRPRGFELLICRRRRNDPCTSRRSKLHRKA